MAAQRYIAFYLPQFHPIPENSRWWGMGYTEWHNVAKAKPLFKGHEQPKLPGELGFYDLRLPQTQIDQANLALDYGIEAFCYWHYWFGHDKRLLQRPYESMLKNPDIKIKHCFCWANHDWTKSWLGENNKVLMPQVYNGKYDYEKHFYEMLHAFNDSRYFKVNGKNFVGIYDLTKLGAREFVDIWMNLASKEGLPEFAFFSFIRDHKFSADQNKLPISFWTKHNPPIDWEKIKQSLSFRFKRKLNRFINHSCTKYDYNDYIDNSCNNLSTNELPCVVANWDRTPRAKHNGEVFVNFSPELFRKLIMKANRLIGQRPEQERIIFLKSWNEWAEGNYLEPDLVNGRILLEQLKI